MSQTPKRKCGEGGDEGRTEELTLYGDSTVREFGLRPWTRLFPCRV